MSDTLDKKPEENIVVQPNYVVDDLRPDLGGNLRHGDLVTFSPKVWEFVVSSLGVTSVLDVGAGEGYSSRWFNNAGLITYAFDGLRANVDRAVYPMALHDLNDGPFYCNVDLVHCVEVVEHLTEDLIPNLMRTFDSGKFVLITHALPNQPGHHHVNCQTSSWWVERFADYGWSVMTAHSVAIRKLAAQETTPTFFANSGLLFAKDD